MVLKPRYQKQCEYETEIEKFEIPGVHEDFYVVLKNVATKV